MDISFRKTNGPLDELIDQVMALAEVNHPDIVREMIISALKTGQENDYLADLKMLRATMKEMRYTSKVFGPYRERKKVTIFGSARTAPDEAIYQKCVTFSRQLVRLGYMVITGGGPGIMQAGNEGAGAENSCRSSRKPTRSWKTVGIPSPTDISLRARSPFSKKRMPWRCFPVASVPWTRPWKP
jgi:hypothetical protein